ncbi:MAG: trypsin-like peptidase domain-containing protein, partial [Planctomycetaceae bacterium]
PGCLACQRMSPVVAKLKREGYSIRVLDIRRAPRLARQLNIKLLPTFVLVEKGRAVRRIVGATTESRLRELVSSARASGPGSTTDSPSSRRGLDRFARPVPADKAGKVDRQDSPVVRAKLEAATSATSSGPMSSCVRLRLEQPDGHEFASGTVIGSRPGRAIILTCGHLFRSFRAEKDSRGTPGSASRLIVDIFDGRRSKAYFARLLGYDLESDVGLVEIAAPRVLPVARVSSAANGLTTGQRLLSFGCNGGERPTRSLVTVTQMNRYLGPDNIECTGVPLQGRSGGGLFDAAGRVVGVCFAADPTYQRGLYAGLKPIQDLLVRCRLTSLFKHRDQPGPQRDAVPTVASVAASGPAGTASTRLARTTGVAKPRTVSSRSGPPAVPPRSTSGRSTTAAEVAAALASASGA